MDPWLMSWVVIHVVLQVLCLIHLARKRHLLETRVVVKWALLLVLVPVVGVIGYLFFLLEKGVQRGTPGRRDETASFLRNPRIKDR